MRAKAARKVHNMLTFGEYNGIIIIENKKRGLHMEQITMFKAFDGKVFADPQECREYEKTLWYGWNDSGSSNDVDCAKTLFCPTSGACGKFIDECKERALEENYDDDFTGAEGLGYDKCGLFVWVETSDGGSYVRLPVDVIASLDHALASSAVRHHYKLEARND